MKKYIFPVVMMLLICAAGANKMQEMNASKSLNSKEEYEQSKEKNEALDALEFLNTSRAFPGNDIPADAERQAWKFYQDHFLSHSQVSRLAAPAWSSIGPNNVGGRTLCMAFDPVNSSIIWMGSASGGLWKSTTGGIGVNAWTYIPTGYPVRGVSSIAINPQNPLEMYIGTGETYTYGSSVNGLVYRPTRGSNGIGILKSMDGGMTWSPSLNWTYDQRRGIWKVLLNPLNPMVVYAATTEGIYKSDDAGATWTLRLNQKMVMDLQIDPLDTNILYAGVGNVNSANPGIYRTVNSGLNWLHMTSGLPPPTNTGRISIAINPQNHQTVLAIVGDLYSTVGIYRSYDQGAHWQSIFGLTEIVDYQGWYAKGICYKKNDSTQVLFGGIYPFISLQSGDFPQLLTNPYDIHPDIHDIVSDPNDPMKIYYLTDGGLYRSDDFATTFYDCNDGYATSQSYIGSVSQQDPSIVLSGLQDNNTIYYMGGNYWYPVIGGDGSYNIIDPVDDAIQYGSYQYLNIINTPDYWGNVNYVFSHTANTRAYISAAFLAPFVYDHNTCIMYAAADTLFRSDNCGTSWSTPSNAPINLGSVGLCLAMSASDPDSVYIATTPDSSHAMKFFLSTDGGVTQLDKTAGLPNRYPRDIAIDPRDSKIVYAVFSGFGSGHVFRSVNAGDSWTDISTTLPDIPFHCVMLDPLHPDSIYTGSDFGIFVSADTGSTWDAFSDGMPDGVMVFDLQYSSVDQSILAFTHGSGVYKANITNLPLSVPEKENTISLFELINNPVHDQLRIRFPNSLYESPALKIYSIDGKLMRQQSSGIHRSKDREAECDVSGLPAGIYLLEITCNQKSQVRRFVRL